MKALLALAAIAAAVAPASAGAAPRLAAHEDPVLGRLLVASDRVKIGYRVDASSPKLAGTLFVRNDLRRSFVRVPLKADGPLVSAAVPASLLRGHRLDYYAVVRDLKSKRSATLPHASSLILRKPALIDLGKHVYGQTRAPAAVVARAAPDEVTWDTGEGFSVGPQTFQVGADGGAWLQDSIGNRLLVWNAGAPDTIAHTIPLHGYGGQGDFVPAPDGTVFSSAPGNGKYGAAVFHLGPAGSVLSAIALPPELGFPVPTGQLPLRFGPDGRLYCAVGGQTFGRTEHEGWMPVARANGTGLTVAQQRRGTLWGYEPLAGGLRLVSDWFVPFRSERGPRDVRYALLNRGGKVLRSWRVVSRTEVFIPGPSFFVPELAGRDPVVDLDVAKPGTLEHVVLRLGPHGSRDRFSLPYSIWGDELYADLRFGLDGKLYRLSTSPTNGVTISRYPLQP
jgi:hypothetical protein